MKKHEIRKNAYKFVGKILSNQHSIERAVKEARLQPGGHSGGGGGHAFVSDPTAQQAVRLAMELKAVTLDDGWTLRWPERWLKVVKCAYENCYPYEARAMRYYYDGHTADKIITESKVVYTCYGYAKRDDGLRFRRSDES